jgi:hypothetical protein
LAGHNVREALALVRALVIGSDSAIGKGNGSSEFAFECLLAVWGNEALRSRGVGNCFDAEPSSPPLHALRIRLLAYYAWAFSSASDRSLLEITDSVLGKFGSWGYAIGSIQAALGYLLAAGLLRASDWQPFEPLAELPKRITITASGYVHLTQLVDISAYRAAMACITSWYDQELADRFVRLAQAAGGAEGPTIADIAASGGARSLMPT